MSFLVKTLPAPTLAGVTRIALGRGRFAVVDPEDFEQLNKYRWYAKMSSCCWYAVRKKWTNGKCVLIRMHREIMNTPEDWDCHHLFSNTLDNRKAFLLNCTKEEHREIHRTRHF